MVDGFDNLLNFRDVAESINQSTGRTTLRPGLFYRSGRPDEASKRDKRKLTEAYKITTVIDLRTTTEHIEAAKVRRGRESPPHLSTDSNVNKIDDGPLPIIPALPDIRQVNINLNGKGFERSLIWRLSYFNLARVMSLMAFGYRLEAISIISREILQPRGLVGLGIDTVDYCQPELKAIFDLLAKPSNWPLMIHCTQGKDRTGITALLVLLLCGVDTDAIAQDYLASDFELLPELEDRVRDLKKVGLGEAFARCERDFPVQITKHIDHAYGGIQSYLRTIGVDDEAQQTIRSLLIVGEADCQSDDNFNASQPS